ncbi:MAG: methylmalonyl-CoA epimerase [Planctomycetota bacterium]|jgi:methylmalonyl-CoA/ethylmalonyl-CoA epimerase
MTPPDPDAPIPRLGPVDHLGIAVESLDAGKALYGDTLGLRLLFEEEIPSEHVRVAAYDGGGVRLELLESTDPDGPIARHVKRRGPGIHHVCYRVEDIERALAGLRARGIDPIGEAPRPGAGGCRVAFLHPRDAGGVLVELSQPPEGGGHGG